MARLLARLPPSPWSAPARSRRPVPLSSRVLCARWRALAGRCVSVVLSASMPRRSPLPLLPGSLPPSLCSLSAVPPGPVSARCRRSPPSVLPPPPARWCRGGRVVVPPSLSVSALRAVPAPVSPLLPAVSSRSCPRLPLLVRSPLFLSLPVLASPSVFSAWVSPPPSFRFLSPAALGRLRRPPVCGLVRCGSSRRPRCSSRRAAFRPPARPPFCGFFYSF